VTAGSVVTASIPPMTVVQGNPAKAVARAGIPLVDDELELREFLSQVTPIH
jgi:acetyltransferase-like isoleucine patch superfamily enzyme